MRPFGVGGPGSILPSEKTKEFLNLCEKIHTFLQDQLYRHYRNQPTAVSLEKMRSGEFYTKKFLAVGLILVGTPSRKDPKTTSLRIFFDPSRFKKWEESIGPAKLVFFNPYDIEISRSRREDKWYLVLDGKNLNMDLERKSPYEVAAIEIQERLGNIDAVRIR